MTEWREVAFEVAETVACCNLRASRQFNVFDAQTSGHSTLILILIVSGELSGMCWICERCVFGR